MPGLRIVLSALILAGAMALAATRPALAQDSGGDRAAIQGMIQDQISAFQRDDGPAAYRHASPTIQGLFPSIDQFMAMVRGGYMPVYRPQSVVFGQLKQGPTGPVQEVFITGPDGQQWLAEYTLQQQPDGTWRINGVRLKKDNGGLV